MPNQAAIRVAIVLLALCTFMSAKERQKDAPMPSSAVIARHTFFDFGTPFDYYELISLKPTKAGTLISRITASPSGDACTQHAKIEVAEATVAQSVATLLEGRNPCVIPERALKRELKRRKHGLVFSGSEISIRVSCGDRKRTIRADVLDRDMFDPNARTPENSSWTMRLLARVDSALGGDVWDKPMFTVGNETPARTEDTDLLREVATGNYDDLFASAPHKLSELYRASKVGLPAPQVLLVSSSPYEPSKFTLPQYPPIARAAHIEGQVVFTTKPDGEGHTHDITFKSAHPMLKGAVQESVSNWEFPEDAANQLITGTVEFKLNCVLPPKP